MLFIEVWFFIQLWTFDKILTDSITQSLCDSWASCLYLFLSTLTTLLKKCLWIFKKFLQEMRYVLGNSWLDFWMVSQNWRFCVSFRLLLWWEEPIWAILVSFCRVLSHVRIWKLWWNSNDFKSHGMPLKFWTLSHSYLNVAKRADWIELLFCSRAMRSRIHCKGGGELALKK